MSGPILEFIYVNPNIEGALEKELAKVIAKRLFDECNISFKSSALACHTITSNNTSSHTIPEDET